MIDAFGGDRWWPLNCQVALLRTDPERVLEALDPQMRGQRAVHPDLAGAVEACAPYPYGRGTTTFVVPTADGSAAVLSTTAPSIHPSANVLVRLAPNLGCDGVAVDWKPRHRDGLAAAGFDDYRYSPSTPPAPGGRATDELTLQVSDQGRRWVFVRIPPGAGHQERNYEEPEVYRARITADRLPLGLIRRYLVAVGVPVDDREYFCGPVLSVSFASKLVAEHTWSTMAELRAFAGYPPDSVPTALRSAPAASDHQGV